MARRPICCGIGAPVTESKTRDGDARILSLRTGLRTNSLWLRVSAREEKNYE
jgi:hypothetical protein